MALYQATDGPNWKNNDKWLSDVPINQWHGVTTDLEGRVFTLELDSNNLSGEIPREIGSLSNLTKLDLGSNNLSATIPEELGNLLDLEWLLLRGNQLRGSIPKELGSLSSLVWLDLSSNQLSGTIPVELGSLSTLESLSLHNNQLIGVIPAELGNLSNLEWLDLSSNQLDGEIPRELGNLYNLETMFLSNNQLSGEISRELRSLSNQAELYLNCNRFSGEILPTPTPDELDVYLDQIMEQARVEAGLSADWIRLAELYHATCGPSWKKNDNWLSDKPISEWYGVTTDDSGSVTELQLVGNGLDGTIPADLESLANLQGLYLSGNSLTDCIPRGLSNVQFNDLSDLGLPFCGATTPPPALTTPIPVVQAPTLAPTPIPSLATEVPTPVPTRTLAPTPTPAVERGFFFNSNPVRAPETERSFNLLDPVTLSLIGIVLTLIATSIQLFKGK